MSSNIIYLGEVPLATEKTVYSAWKEKGGVEMGEEREGVNIIKLHLCVCGNSIITFYN
jgi:hypothetical protein